jgi:hypothetical protein
LTYLPIGAPAPGDANGDGTVDSDDAAILAAHWGQDGWATWADGDFNRDGQVNAADASILAANWGRTSEAAGVPEPTATAMLLGLVALLLARPTIRASATGSASAE